MVYNITYISFLLFLILKICKKNFVFQKVKSIFFIPFTSNNKPYKMYLRVFKMNPPIAHFSFYYKPYEGYTAKKACHVQLIHVSRNYKLNTFLFQPNSKSEYFGRIYGYLRISKRRVNNVFSKNKIFEFFIQFFLTKICCPLQYFSSQTRVLQ